MYMLERAHKVYVRLHLHHVHANVHNVHVKEHNSCTYWLIHFHVRSAHANAHSVHAPGQLTKFIKSDLTELRGFTRVLCQFYVVPKNGYVSLLFGRYGIPRAEHFYCIFFHMRIKDPTSYIAQKMPKAFEIEFANEAPFNENVEAKKETSDRSPQHVHHVHLHVYNVHANAHKLFGRVPAFT